MPGAHGRLGLSLDKAGDYLGAENAYKEEIRLHPSDAVPHYNLASLYDTHLANYAAAESEYRAAARLDPSDPDAHYWLGRLYIKEGKTGPAKAEVKALQSLDPARARSLAKRISP